MLKINLKKYIFLLFSLFLIVPQKSLGMKKLIKFNDDGKPKLDLCTPGVVCCPVGCAAKGCGGCCTVGPYGACFYYFPATFFYCPFFWSCGLCCIDKDGDLEDHICYFGPDDCLNGGFLKNGCKLFSKIILGAKNIANQQLNGVKHQIINMCKLDEDDYDSCCEAAGDGCVKCCCFPASVMKKFLADCSDLDEDDECSEILEESCKRCWCCIPVPLITCVKACYEKLIGVERDIEGDVISHVQAERGNISEEKNQKQKEILDQMRDSWRPTGGLDGDVLRDALESEAHKSDISCDASSDKSSDEHSEVECEEKKASDTDSTSTDSDEEDAGFGISSYFSVSVLDNEHIDNLKQKASGAIAGLKSFFWGNAENQDQENKD